MIFAGLSVLSGLSLNLVLQFAIGAAPAGKTKKVPVYQLICLFITVIFLWILFTYILTFLSQEIIAYFLMFPFSALILYGLEQLENTAFAKKKKVRLFRAMTAYEGLAPASLILTIKLASNFIDALVLSFFFAFGCLLAAAIMKDIRRRSFMEVIPQSLRGLPMAFISMGLLAMVFGTAAKIIFNL